MENEEGIARLIVGKEGQVLASGNIAAKIDSGGGKSKVPNDKSRERRRQAIEALKNNPGPDTPPTPPPMKKIVISKENNL